MGATKSRAFDRLGSTLGASVRLSNSRIHNGQRTPGPSPPVATTRDENAMDKHGGSVANRLHILAKTLMPLEHARPHNLSDT